MSALIASASSSANRTSHVVDHLTTAILDRVYSPGSQLPPERELAQELGVSRNVVREATKTLQSRGLLSVEHGRGTIVTGVTTGPVSQVFENALHGSGNGLIKVLQVRMPLEVEIAALAARHRLEKHLKATRELLNSMRNQLRDVPRYAQSDVAFHHSLAEATGNELFVVVLESLSGLLAEYRLQALGQSSTRLAQEHHESIFAAIEAQDASAAAREMRHHLQTSLHETELNFQQSQSE